MDGGATGLPSLLGLSTTDPAGVAALRGRRGPGERLRVPLGTAAFLLRRTTYSGARRVSYVNYWVRGDRYTFQDTFEP